MKCEICPRQCGIDRETKFGFCGAGNVVKIAKYTLFEYEEPCISGKGGSGCIFFTGCSLKCVYCQNYEISSKNVGKEFTVNELADIFKQLEEKGAENINLVNPTHYVMQIIQALKIYRPKIPIVYNTHGYEKVETLILIAPYIDVFLPDFKYFDNETALKYSNCKNYVENVKKALIVMRELKKDVFVDEMMKSGLLIRHLILPLQTNQSKQILLWIKQNLPNTLVSLMAQYTPYANACKFKEINRRITKREYESVVNYYLELGLDGYVQDRTSSDVAYIPTWDFLN